MIQFHPSLLLYSFIQHYYYNTVSCIMTMIQFHALLLPFIWYSYTHHYYYTIQLHPCLQFRPSLPLYSYTHHWYNPVANRSLLATVQWLHICIRECIVFTKVDEYVRWNWIHHHCHTLLTSRTLCSGFGRHCVWIHGWSVYGTKYVSIVTTAKSQFICESCV